MGHFQQSVGILLFSKGIYRVTQTKKFFSSSYCGNEFSCMVKYDNVFGLQFHPEKSREIGLELINDIIRY